MMSDEYISRDGLLGKLCRRIMIPQTVLEAVLADIPSADVAPIRRGHWIEDQDRIVCSECGARFKDEIIYMQENKTGAQHRCLECGAIMDGGIEDE